MSDEKSTQAELCKDVIALHCSGYVRTGNNNSNSRIPVMFRGQRQCAKNSMIAAGFDWFESFEKLLEKLRESGWTVAVVDVQRVTEGGEKKNFYIPEAICAECARKMTDKTRKAGISETAQA